MTKIEAFWENATADDVARVMAGETVEARFRDSEVRDWQIGRLNGWADREFRCELANCWRFCQVYREPSWWTKRPDPGPGWRLLGKFPDEELKPGDEIWLSSKQWASSHNAETGKKLQQKEVWYRRRIEPVEPVESKPVLIRRRVVEIGDELKLPNGSVWVFNGEGFEVKQ
jgi:hypothetical protein